VNRIFYLLFIAAVFLISCSGLDETSNLGKGIIKPIVPDSLQSGVYNTIWLTQGAQTFGSVADSDSIRFVYIASDSSHRFTQWAVGNWGNEQAILKLSHFKTEKDTLSIKDYLLKLVDSAAVIDSTIKADIVWTNSVNLNSFDNAKVEIGAIFNDTNFFPLNFISVNSRLQTSFIPITLETYLLNANKNDSTIIQRFDVRSAFFIDTILIDSIFADKGKITDTIHAEVPTMQNFQSDVVVPWEHFVVSSFYDSVKIDTLPNESVFIEEIKLLSKKVSGQRDTIGRISHKKYVLKNEDLITDPFVIDTTYDTITIVFDTAMTLRTSRKSFESKRTDSVFVNPEAKTHKVTQFGLKYKVALDDPQKGIRAVGGNGFGNIDISTLSDTLNMYLRIDESSSFEGILHLSAPALRVNYKKVGGKENKDTTFHQKIIYFAKIGVLSKSSDILENKTPVISGALERFAEIDLDLSDFFYEITKEKFLSVGLADLTLSLDGKTDFPAQYGDSIQINAIVSSEKLTPKSLYALPNTRKASRFWIKRDSSSVKVPLAGTLVDFVYEHRVFEKPAPANAYLYMWLENWRIGRIYFEPNNPEFTYILQVRKGGE